MNHCSVKQFEDGWVIQDNKHPKMFIHESVSGIFILTLYEVVTDNKEYALEVAAEYDFSIEYHKKCLKKRLAKKLKRV